jgi:hypothetical protein
MAEAVVARFTGLAEAQVALATLTSEGIDARLDGDQLVGVAWHLSNAIGGIRLLVRNEDLQRARDALKPPEVIFDREEERSEADALAARAWQSALIGLLVFPPLLHFWSLWLISASRRAGGARTAMARRDLRRAAWLSGICIAIAILVATAALLVR